MNALPDPARRRLAGALALAASTSGAPDGERLAAIAAAERLLGAAGLALPDLARALAPEPAAAAPWTAASDRDAGGMPWRQMVDALLGDAAAGLLSAWEAGFVRSIAFRWRPPTPKQAAVLRRLYRARGR